MLAILTSTGRVLLRHWPAMLAWFLAGTLGHYLAIQLAGWVGAWSATGGFLLLPLAILARLISFVAMFLVVRDGLRNLQSIAPVSDDPVERRGTFGETLLVSILPFFAIYAAWGFLRDDVNAYAARALEVRTTIRWTELAEQIARDDYTSTSQLPEDAVLQLGFNPASITVIIVAFAARWAWKRYAARLPKLFAVLAVYMEAVWVGFSLFLISDGVDAVTGWIDSRAAMVWLAGLRDWVGDQLAPVGWLWSGVEWLLGAAGGILLQPLAWLTIAGVIYGQAIAVESVRVQVRNEFLTRTRDRMQRLPGPLSRWLAEFGEEFVGRFRPMGRAIALMWRAGPVMIATYVLLYTIVLAAEPLLSLAITRILGPHDLYAFWRVADALIFLIVPIIVEPLRVAVVSAAYDGTLGALRAQASATVIAPPEETVPTAASVPAPPAPVAPGSVPAPPVAPPAPPAQGSIEN